MATEGRRYIYGKEGEYSMIIKGCMPGLGPCHDLGARVGLGASVGLGTCAGRGAVMGLGAGIMSLSLCWTPLVHAESSLLFQCQMTTGTHVLLTDEGSELEYRMGMNLAAPDAQFRVPKSQVSTKPWRQDQQEASYSLTLPYKSAAITLFYSHNLQKQHHAVNAGLFVKQPGQAADLMMCRNGTVEQHLRDFSPSP